jgi:hypothetical protein
MTAFSREEKIVLRRVRDAKNAKDEADLEWRLAIVAAGDVGIPNRQIERFAGTTNTNVGNIIRRAKEMKILAAAERKAKREAKKAAA